MSNKKQFAVIGLGRFGGSVARTLSVLGHEVLGIDNNDDVVQELSNDLTHVVALDIHDEIALRSQGLHNFDSVVVAIGDTEASLLVTLMLKDFGVENVIVMATGLMHGRMLKKIGANQVIYPHSDMGKRVAYRLAAANVVDFIDLDGLRVIEIEAPPMLIGKSLKDSGLREKYDVNALAVKTRKETLVPPPPDMIIGKDDIVVLIGKNESLKKLEASIW